MSSTEIVHRAHVDRTGSASSTRRRQSWVERVVAAAASCIDLVGAAAMFICRGMSLRDLESVNADPAQVRLVTLIRLTVFRRREGHQWPYRPRRARHLRQLRRMLPEWAWYRGLILPLALVSLARMARKTAVHYGPALREQTGIPLIRQLLDALTISLRCPGTLPSEYYVFGMHEAAARRGAGDIANGYDVETVASLVYPARHLEQGSGFPSEDIDLLNNKDRFRQLCRRTGVPVVEAIVCFSDGRVEWSREPELPKRDLFVKPLYGGGGYGAARVFYSPIDDAYRLDAPKTSVTEQYPDSPMTATELVDFFQRIAARIPFVIEPRVVAHVQLRELVGSATLPTLRVVTAIHASGKARTLAVYLRAATTNTSVDNVSSGGIAALVDPRTCRIVVAVTGFGGAVAEHPLTGRPLKGAGVPFADRASVVGMEMHRAVAAAQDVPVPVLGWDIAVTDDGPVFVEGNPLSDLTTAQKLLDRGFWADSLFRPAILSHLAALGATRISIDPGSVHQ